MIKLLGGSSASLRSSAFQHEPIAIDYKIIDF